MSALFVISMLASMWIIVTYLGITQGWDDRHFHAANAIGFIPIAAFNISVGAWPPLALTLFFGAIGWVGLLGSDS